MKIHRLFALQCVFFLLGISIAQGEATNRIVHLALAQPDSLKVNVEAVEINGTSYLLGSSLIVSGGTPEYVYLWTPSTNLDNPTLLNPTASSAQIPEYKIVITDKNNCSTCALVNLLKTDINQLESSKNNISLYPVPTIDKLFVKLTEMEGPCEISVMNSSGVTLQNMLLKIQDNHQIQILNFTGYPTGSYLITVKSKTCSGTKLFIIK